MLKRDGDRISVTKFSMNRFGSLIQMIVICEVKKNILHLSPYSFILITAIWVGFEPTPRSDNCASFKHIRSPFIPSISHLFPHLVTFDVLWRSYARLCLECSLFLYKCLRWLTYYLWVIWMALLLTQKAI